MALLWSLEKDRTFFGILYDHEVDPPGTGRGPFFSSLDTSQMLYVFLDSSSDEDYEGDEVFPQCASR
jgi:hypothetical protein